MKVRASAPGKLVVLGEYAVLTGAQALVMAVDRRCEVEIAPYAGPRSQLETRAPASQITEFEPGQRSGLDLVDTVRFGLCDPAAEQPLRAVLDSTAFFAHDGNKLGLGSSAAVLTAWAGALQAYDKKDVSELTLARLIDLHRALQGGRGSGIDVAAALHGGLSTFQLDYDHQARIGSVRLPNSVGFAGIFAGKSATTSDFVGRFNEWRQTEPQQAEQLLSELASVSAAGCAALAAADAEAFLAAVAEYGRLLDALGNALRCDVLTPEHRQIAALAERFAVTYKTSGAGGGDIGIAFTSDADALAALRIAVAEEGFLWVDLSVAAQGLLVEELTE
jgi:phosphomevalonate kinase